MFLHPIPLDQAGADLGNGAAGQQRTAGLGITYGRGSADKAWTENVTVIAGTKTVDLKVAGNTHLLGAVVGVEDSEARVDTGTFTYEDLRDYDRSKNLSVNVNLSYSWIGESANGGQVPGREGQRELEDGGAHMRTSAAASSAMRSESEHRGLGGFRSPPLPLSASTGGRRGACRASSRPTGQNDAEGRNQPWCFCRQATAQMAASGSRSYLSPSRHLAIASNLIGPL